MCHDVTILRWIKYSDLKMLKPSDLHDYQVKAYKDIIRDKVFCVSDDCGIVKLLTFGDNFDG